MGNDFLIPFLQFIDALGAVGDFGVNAYNIVAELLGVLFRSVLEVILL